MEFGLGPREISLLNLLSSLGSSTCSISEAAKKMGVSIPVVSRVTASLEKKGFIEMKRDGRHKQISFSNAPHAFAFRQLAAENPHVALEHILSDSTIRVLSGMTTPYASIATISDATRTPRITAQRVISKLLERGAVTRMAPGMHQMILPRLKEFVEAYSFYALDKKRDGIHGSIICRGPHGILRSSADAPTYMVPTGISVFANYSIKIIQTDFSDYYFNLFDEHPRNPSLEEAVAHSLLRSTLIASCREVSYAMLVLHKNFGKIKKERFFQIAEYYGVLKDAKRCLELVEKFIHGSDWPEYSALKFSNGFRQVEGPFYPTIEEFKELVRQYE